MHGFELDRGDLAEAALTTSTMVGALDPHHDREPQVLSRLPARRLNTFPCTSAKNDCIDALAAQVSDAAHRPPEAGCSQRPQELPGPATLITRPYPLADGGEGTDLYLTRQGVKTAFAADLPRRTTDLMFATQRPFSEEAFGSPSGAPAWKSIPSWYLVASQDRAIPPATQRFMAERAEAQTTEVRASHVPQISRPGATTRIILEAAESLN